MTQSAYIEFEGKICVIGSAVIDTVFPLRKWKWCVEKAKQQAATTRAGGNGRPSLIEFSAIPSKYREQIVAKFGNPTTAHNPLEKFFTIDGAARMFYDTFRDECGTLTKEQIEQYTINASVLTAVNLLRKEREMMTKRSGNNRRNVWGGIISDLMNFKDTLKNRYGRSFDLPMHERKLREKVTDYLKLGYSFLISKKRGNSNAQVVTPEMVQLWNDMFAGRRFKPTHIEVAVEYKRFLAGELEIINAATGECYNPKSECFTTASESSIYNYLSDWENRAVTFSKRDGDRQRFMGKFIPHASMKQPAFAGSIISVDDRQPPFKWAEGGGNRMWFYMAQDLGSEAFTTWVYGDTKEGIITDFYRQMVRNYAAWGLNLPYEIECEASLNSSFANTFLESGAMFQQVRIIPNMARSKRIERTFGALRNQYERKNEAFISRPHATAEHLQSKQGKVTYLPKDEIVQHELRLIEQWNNELHPNQDLHPNLTRWDVFMEKQNPNLKPTNWAGILPHLGHATPTSMKLGRIMLQGKLRVVGLNGSVALGQTLLDIMSQIEGCDVRVMWLDGNDGDVLKSLVYDMNGRLICELLDDLPHHRAEAEQTDQCRINMELTAAYRATVEGYINRNGKQISQIEVIETTTARSTRFQIAEINKREVREREEEPELLVEPDEEEAMPIERNPNRNSMYENF